VLNTQRSLEKPGKARSAFGMTDDGFDRADIQHVVWILDSLVGKECLVDGPRLLRVTSLSACTMGLKVLAPVFVDGQAGARIRLPDEICLRGAAGHLQFSRSAFAFSLFKTVETELLMDEVTWTGQRETHRDTRRAAILVGTGFANNALNRISISDGIAEPLEYHGRNALAARVSISSRVPHAAAAGGREHVDVAFCNKVG
jgi:hypothetical protein